MRRASVVILSLFLGLATACSGTAAGDGQSTSDITTTTGYQLPGFTETLIVADRDGRMSLVKLGATTTVTPVESLGSPVLAGRSHEGKLWVLAANGTLATINPESGAVSGSVNVAVTGPGDLDLESGDVAWISASDGRVLRVVGSTGEVTDTIDLTEHALSGGKVVPHGITRVGDRLFVQIARKGTRGPEDRGALAVIDSVTKQLVKVVELEVPSTDGAELLAGFDPGGPMIVDEAHGKLLLTARGFRPSNTGMILRLDLARLELDPWFHKQGAGFQGGLSLGAPEPDMYIGYHTSTPVASTHIFHYRLGEGGELEAQNAGTIVEAFEVLDDYPVNASRTLLAFPVACSVGFCVGGAGVSFVDMKTATVHPRLSANDLGLKPTFVLFL